MAGGDAGGGVGRHIRVNFCAKLGGLEQMGGSMFRGIVVVGFSVLAMGCQTPAPSVINSDVAEAIERPTDPQAAALLGQFEDTLLRSMPIVDQIAVLQLRDRFVRDVFVDIISDASLSAETRDQFEKAAGRHMTRIDAENTAELKRLLASEFTIVEIATVSPHLFGHMFSIVQHSSDKEFRDEVLATIEPLALSGKVEGELYATMFDRVQLTNGRSQRYGTQVKCIDGKYDVHNLEDPDGVDARRAALGLGSLSVGVTRNQALYGPC